MSLWKNCRITQHKNWEMTHKTSKPASKTVLAEWVQDWQLKSSRKKRALPWKIKKIILKTRPLDRMKLSIRIKVTLSWPKTQILYCSKRLSKTKRKSNLKTRPKRKAKRYKKSQKSNKIKTRRHIREKKANLMTHRCLVVYMLINSLCKLLESQDRYWKR